MQIFCNGFFETIIAELLALVHALWRIKFLNQLHLIFHSHFILFFQAKETSENTTALESKTYCL